MSIWIVEHLSFPGSGYIEHWAGKRMRALGFANPFRDGYWQGPPPGTDAVILTGGAMNIDQEDQYPWIRDEQDFIRKYVEKGGKMLGICLGAQLIAKALGGAVSKNDHKEIGWHPVRFHADAPPPRAFAHFPERAVSMHWHGHHVSTLPESARLLASSACTPVQLFAIGDQVAGFQYHPEFTGDMLAHSIEKHGHELMGGPWEQMPEELKEGHKKHAAENHRMLSKFLDLFFEDDGV